MSEDNKNSVSAKVVTALIIGLILGFAAGAFWQGRRNSAPLPSETAATAAAAGAVAEAAEEKKETETGAALPNAPKSVPETGTGAILVVDQAAGGTAIISQVISADSVWVAVREERSGVPGNILGARKVPAGTSSAVIVELLRPTVAGARYFAVLYRDAGDPAFNYREDIFLKDTPAPFIAK